MIGRHSPTAVVHENQNTHVTSPYRRRNCPAANLEMTDEIPTLLNLIQTLVDQTLGNIAVSFEGETLSYRQLNIRANQLAYHLHSSTDTHGQARPPSSTQKHHSLVSVSKPRYRDDYRRLTRHTMGRCSVCVLGSPWIRVIHNTACWTSTSERSGSCLLLASDYNAKRPLGRTRLTPSLSGSYSPGLG